MIGGSVLYLFMAGLDMGTAAEQLLNGMYYELRAARHSAVHPRRRVHDHRQHHGTAAELLQRVRRALPRRPRSRQRRAKHHLRGDVGLGPRGRRELGQADAENDDAGRQIHGELCRRPDGGILGHRAHHPALDPDGDLRPGLRHVHRLPVPRRRHPGPAHRHRADGLYLVRRQAKKFPGRESRPAARHSAHHVGRLPRADDAGDPSRLPLQRDHHAHGSRRARRLRTRCWFPRFSIAPSPGAASTTRC